MTERHWSDGSLTSSAAEVAQKTRRSLRDLTSHLVKIRAELLISIALLSGWMLITYGIATLTSSIAWIFSLGLLLLLLCGWRFLWRLFSDGLYDLSRERKRG